MSRFARLFLPCVALSLFAFGCDDEPTTDGGTMDGGTGGGGMCPAQAPDRDGLMAPCCFRESNEDKLATPGFRLTSMAISKPTSLANPIIAPIIQGALDGETFNWLVQLGGADADGDITLRTGFGIRNADTSFSFAFGAAPGPGDADRWNPVDIDGTLQGETFGGELDGQMIIPMGDPKKPLLELPLNGVSIEDAKMSESRSCIGTRAAKEFEAGGALSTFVTVEAAAQVKIDQAPLNTFLCNFIAQLAEQDEPCTEFPQADWTLKPDSICDGASCKVGDCDPDETCNAWKFDATFSAAGVAIVDADIVTDGGTDAGDGG